MPAPMQQPMSTHALSAMFAGSPERRLLLLRAVWPAVVGPDLARRSVVVALDGGILRILVPDAAWRKVLFRMRGEILGRLRQSTGTAAPRTLGFVEGPIPGPPPPAPVPSAPKSPEAPPAVRDAADAIPDEGLRARFVDTAAAYLARFGPLEDSDGSEGGGSLP